MLCNHRTTEGLVVPAQDLFYKSQYENSNCSQSSQLNGAQSQIPNLLLETMVGTYLS